VRTNRNKIFKKASKLYNILYFVKSGGLEKEIFILEQRE
jgi:hypothetical protein